MRSVVLMFTLSIAGCASHSLDVDSKNRVDRCLALDESKQYLSAQFSYPLETGLSTSPAGKMAVVLSAAIEGRFGRHVSATEMSDMLLRKSGDANKVTFLNVKEAVQELGYEALAWRGGNQDYRKYKRVMALSMDGAFNPFIISGVENGVVHTVYSNGAVCQIDYASFKEESKNYPIMFFTSKS